MADRRLLAVFAAAVLRDLFQANVLALLLKERKRTEASLPRQRGSVPDHGNKSISEGHRECDYLEWIARLTSHIPERGAQAVEGPRVRRFNARRDGVMTSVRAEIGVDADPEENILAAIRSAKRFHGASRYRAASWFRESSQKVESTIGGRYARRTRMKRS